MHIRMLPPDPFFAFALYFQNYVLPWRNSKASGISELDELSVEAIISGLRSPASKQDVDVWGI